MIGNMMVLLLRLQLLLLLLLRQMVAVAAAALLGMMVVQAVAVADRQLQLGGARRGGQEGTHRIRVAAAVRDARVRGSVAADGGRHSVAIDAAPRLVQLRAGESHQTIKTRADPMLPVGFIIGGNNIIYGESQKIILM